MSINVDEKVNKLLMDLAKANEEYNKAINEINEMPHATAAKMIKSLAKLVDILSDLPKEVWLALWYLLRCDADRLTELGIAELKKLLKILKGFADLEKLACEALAESGGEPAPGTGGVNRTSSEYKDQLKNWLTYLCQVIDELPPEATRQQLCQIVKTAIEWLKEHAPLVLEGLLEYFSTELLKQLENWLNDPKVPRWLVLWLLKKIFEAIGEKLAAAMIPALGTALALADLLKVIDLLLQVNSLKEAMDTMQAELICQLVKNGAQWPNCGEYVFMDPSFDGFAMTKRVYVQSASQDADGSWTMDDRKQVCFEGGAKKIEGNLMMGQGLWRNNRFECDFKVDGASANQAATGNASMTTVEICLTKGTQKVTHSITVGAQKK